MEPKSSHKKLGVGIAIVVVVIVLAVVLYSKSSSGTDSTIPPAPTPVSNTASDTSAIAPADSSTNSATTLAYKDGTYTAVGSYVSPGGPDQISVTLTISKDIVTDASVTPMPGDNTSAKYQGIFADNYKTYVVGQDISTLNLTKVSRSSLTPKGFDDALAKIKTQAQA